MDKITVEGYITRLSSDHGASPERIIVNADYMTPSVGSNVPLPNSVTFEVPFIDAPSFFIGQKLDITIRW
jgi:hypothetical protein